MPDRTFELRVLEVGDGYTIFAKDELVGNKERRGVAPSKELERNLAHVQRMLLDGARDTRGVLRKLNRRADRMTVQQMGEEIFRFLLADEVKALFVQSQEAAASAGSRLRVELDLTDAPSLAHVPWELAYDAAVGDHLCLSEFTPVCRSIPTQIRFERAGGTVHILGMVSKPSAPGTLGDTDTIESDREQKSITEALGRLLDDGRVKLGWTTHGSRSELRRMLRCRPSRDGWSVFHFIGHGGYDTQKREGYLLLQQPGGEDVLYATQLRHMLVIPDATPQLVVLNCCSSAKANPGLPFSSVAATLVRGGIPAVIAMQFEVTEKAAQIFSKVFYDWLARGETVQTALTITRQELCAKGISEWATPALYTSGTDFALVKHIGTAAAETAVVEDATP